jgi:serine/threonine protein kinase
MSDIQQTRRTATMKGDTTPAYIAPEVIKGQDETLKVDMWALGIMLYEMVNSLKHPFSGNSPFSMIAAIKDQEPAPLPSSVSPYIRKLIASLLEKNPDKRPDSTTLLLDEKI